MLILSDSPAGRYVIVCLIKCIRRGLPRINLQFKSDSGGLYIVMPNNIGANGCTQNKNSIHLRPDVHSEKFIDSSLSISLAAIASNTKIKVYWNGCLSNGRPKATLLAFGTAEIN